jgi:single-strand DNA-binding protein
MSYEVTGTLIAKFDTQVISERFKKREFVIETRDNSNYTNFVKMQLTNNKCDLVEAFTIGDDLKISFDLRGNKYEKNGVTNYITNVDAWRIQKVGAPNDGGNSTPTNTVTNAAPFMPDVPTSFTPDTPFDNDLPF